MAKAKNTAFFCSSCGYEAAKWSGQCPSCHEWNTMVEAPKESIASQHRGVSSVHSTNLHTEKPKKLIEIDSSDEARFHTGFSEMDRVLGGGLVEGSLILVGGDPGIGKSTLLLQVCIKLAAGGQKVLYVSGEESLRQIKLRANRMGEITGELYFLSETDLDMIERTIEQEKPDTVVIDSIQTIYRQDVASAPGSPAQVRESTNSLLNLAKTLPVTIFIVGHVTKEGVVAGPRMLEHMVDTVLYFEGDRSEAYRILRGVKNRFGSTNEIGVFEMRAEGLIEVENPSEYMLDGRPEMSPGSVVTCSMEGTRPILLEIQALVSRSNFGMPRRTATGTDYNRVNLLMAVLEKRLGMHIGDCDAYVNIAGGMRIVEPSLDLGIVMAMVSSYKDRPLDDHTLVFGEVGLSGEVRSVSQAGQRVAEAQRLGFTRCILPKVCLHQVKADGIELIGVSSVREALEYL